MVLAGQRSPFTRGLLDFIGNLSIDAESLEGGRERPVRYEDIGHAKYKFAKRKGFGRSAITDHDRQGREDRRIMQSLLVQESTVGKALLELIEGTLFLQDIAIDGIFVISLSLYLDVELIMLAEGQLSRFLP